MSEDENTTIKNSANQAQSEQAEAKKPVEADKSVEGKGGERNDIVPAENKRRRSKKGKAPVVSGRVYIKATYNNTIVAITDSGGGVIAWSSAGKCGFKGPKKATPYAATIIVKDVSAKAKGRGLKEVEVFVRGVGQGRESAIRSLNANGIQVISIKDVTPIPHNGCRQKKVRRV